MTATFSSTVVELEPEIRRADTFFTTMRERTTDAPGVTRQSYGEGENIAHALAADWARSLDLEVAHDFAGNQYMTLPGRNRSAPRIIVGSHMDSVPHGGNYDGAAGVVMGLAALERLRRSGYQPAQDFR